MFKYATSDDVLYKIYVPSELSTFYADLSGTRYDEPDGFEVIESPPEEEAMESVRKARNVLLFDSDWTQLPDSPLTEEMREQWRVYRQALRDITENFQWNITKWPETPQST